MKKSVIKNCPDSGVSSLADGSTPLSTELAPGYTNVTLIWKGNNKCRDQLMCLKQYNFKGSKES